MMPLRDFLSDRKHLIAIAALALCAGLVFFYSGGRWPGSIPARQYSNAYALVADKISRSAAIIISLPKGWDKTEAQAGATFDPEIKGSWVETAEPDRLAYQPFAPLETGQYYAVILKMNGAEIAKDFLADDDPAVVAVFPAKDAETDERSEVTIVFNRPMVPLTSLDTLEKTDIPVEISPPTPGKFRWTTTRNLQFIPDDRLARSSSYTVTVRDGLVSMDGLAVPPFSHTFTTRPLRYADSQLIPDGSTVLVHEPVRIRFNQPVDLERTRGEITAMDAGAQRAVPVTVSYGTRVVHEPGKKDQTYTDKSVLEVIGTADRHGRSDFWDFGTNYQITIGHAYPTEGDVELAETRSASFQVPEAIADVSADSPRSKLVAPDMFDPQGRLVVTFHEPVDKDKTAIAADALASVAYGEKCKDADSADWQWYGGNTTDCEKVPDQKKLLLSFRAADLTLDQTVPVVFKRIVNTDGLTLNAEPLTRTIRTYGALRISRTVPADGADRGKLTELKLCTNTPLTPATEENFDTRVRSSESVGKWNWNAPWRVTPGGRPGPCAVGEFENTIRYGLAPEHEYRLDLDLVDDFGQSAQRTLAFTSEPLPAEAPRQIQSLQKEYNVTTPDRVKLTYATQNLPYVDLRICKISAERMLYYLVNPPNDTDSGSGFSCDSVSARTIDLPDRYWTTNYFQFDLFDYVPAGVGHYVLTFSHPEYRRMRYNGSAAVPGEQIYEHTFVTVTNLAVQEKSVEWQTYDYDEPSAAEEAHTKEVLSAEPRNLYWVTETGTLRPVTAAAVQVYRTDNLQLWTSGGGRRTRELELTETTATNGSGIARTKAATNIIGAVIRNGTDSTVVSRETDKFQWVGRAQSVERTYLYSDRPIYRPGQEVHLKGIYRLGFDGNYEIFRDKKAEVKVTNSKQETIYSAELEVSDFGTFTANVALPPDAPLGTYTVVGPGGYYQFDVEEYVPAAFNVGVTSDQEEYIAGDTAKLDIQADYYFGVPVSGGAVEYSILAQDYYFDRSSDPRFSFGSGWYYGVGGYAAGDRFILRDQTTLDASGHARIERALDFDALFKDEDARKTSKIVIVNATVKNENGQSITAQRSFIVHRGEFYLSAKLDQGYFAKNATDTLRIKSLDTEGNPRAVGTIAVAVSRVQWEYAKRQEVDGRYYYRWDRKLVPVRSWTAATDANGDFAEPFTMDTEGEYEIAVMARDRRGNEVSDTYDFYVYGSGVVDVRPTNNETLELAVDKNELEVGESATVIIKSPFRHAKALVTIERGTIYHYDIIDVDQNLVPYTFTAGEEDIPNVYLSVLLLSDRPEVKYGQVNFKVNTKQREVDVTVRSDKNNYLPGEPVHLDIMARDYAGKPVEAELSLAVADLSVLALKGNPKKNPVQFFYSGMPLTVVTASNIKNILFEAEVPAGTKGGGGGSPEDLAMKKRGEFRDTAFWEGTVRTGTDGHAEVTFTLPDNLTTWQAEAVAVTKDTKTGAGYSEFKSRKDVMVVPVRPRFTVPGDEFELGAQVFNQTDVARRFDVAIASTSLLLRGDAERSVSIPAGGSETVYFAVAAPTDREDGSHDFTLSAKTPGYEDAVEYAIPIARNDTYETVATANATTDDTAREYVYVPDNVVPDKGGVSIRSNATLAIFLTDALQYLVQYPYGCSEQIASKIAAVATVKRALKLPNVGEAFSLKPVAFDGREYAPDDVVAIGLSRMLSNQNGDGGFAYYPGMQSSFGLTLHILNTLADLRDAGYAVDGDAITRAAKFVAQQVMYRPEYVQNRDALILAAYAVSRTPEASAAADATLRSRVIAAAGEKKFTNEDASNITLARLAMLPNYPSSVTEPAFVTLGNRVNIDARGAHLSTANGSYLYDFFESPITDTALYLKALAADRRQSPVMDKLLRWIVASRSKDGAWGSSRATLDVLDALVSYLEWSGETESQFDLSVLLDGKEEGSFSFGKDTIFATFGTEIPMADLAAGLMHTIDFTKTNEANGKRNFYYEAALKYFLPIDAIPPRDEGFGVTREFFRRNDEASTHPVTDAKVGEVLRGRLTVTVPTAAKLVAVEDFIPAGLEIVNTRLATEDQTLAGSQNPYEYNDYYDQYNYLNGDEPGNEANTAGNVLDPGSFLASIFGFGGGGAPPDLPDSEYSPRDRVRNQRLFPTAEESHDDRLFLFVERLMPGVYTFEYQARALVPGKFLHRPAVVSEMYFPEVFGRTAGEYFTVQE